MIAPVRRRWIRVLAFCLLVTAIGCAAFLIWAHRPAIALVGTQRFAPGQVARGAALARIGNCLSCHQAAGGAPFAGGYPVKTPFGTVYGTNITPDRETGIGGWSLAAFARSMREGVSRDGHHLYPAFPYTHFRRVDDADMAALYAYVMTRPPVRATPPANAMIPPLGFRPLLARWKLLFLPNDPLPADPRRSASWNRGAYLSEGLGHCSGCHSPRNVLGGEQRDRAYAGGWSGGWYAPPINAQSPAVRAWTVDRLNAYLRTGLSVHHAAAAGPMGDVTRNLAEAPAADVRAIADYHAWWMRDAPAARAEPRLPDRAAAAARAHPRGGGAVCGRMRHLPRARRADDGGGAAGAAARHAAARG